KPEKLKPTIDMNEDNTTTTFYSYNTPTTSTTPGTSYSSRLLLCK
ncbi:10406_t:CDS:1, partial [Paraglomus occultum]